MNEDFLDLLRALSGANVRFLVIGAYAVAVHGHPRATADIDIWVDASLENATRVMRALREFGAPLHDLSEEDLAKPGVGFQVGLPPRRIDLLTSVSGLRFEDAWLHQVQAPFGDVICAVIGLDDLIVNKKAANRPKDIADAAVLERVKRLQK